MFDALVGASRETRKEPVYVDFIEAGPGLLKPVLECIVENARSTKKGFSVGGYLNHIVESVIQQTWSITSLLKDQETRVKVLLHEHVSEGKLADEIKEQLLKFMNKYHMYITGIIAVSFYYIHTYSGQHYLLICMAV